MNRFVLVFFLLFSFQVVGKENYCLAEKLMFQDQEKIGFKPLYQGMKISDETQGFKFDYPSKVGEHCGAYSATYTDENGSIFVVLSSERVIIDLTITTKQSTCERDAVVEKAKQVLSDLEYLEPFHYKLEESQNDSPLYTIGHPIKGILMVKPSWAVSIGKDYCFD